MSRPKKMPGKVLSGRGNNTKAPMNGFFAGEEDLSVLLYIGNSLFLAIG